MASPGVEIVGGPWGSILELWGAFQLLYNKTSTKCLKNTQNSRYTAPAADINNHIGKTTLQKF